MDPAQLTTLEPTVVWSHFAELLRTPRPSKQEQKAIDYVRAWSESRGYPHRSDSVGNICVSVPGSPGSESAPSVMIQGHVDIVTARSEEAPDHADAERGMIPIARGEVADNAQFTESADGDWIKAIYTTLGADNGIGCCMGMAVAEMDDVRHPPLELLFTIDEEQGLTGALQLDASALDVKSKILINLDTEDDDELTIGCAGGLDSELTWRREQVDVSGKVALEVVLEDLRGGHSGVEINSGRANAIRALARALRTASTKTSICLVAMNGGEKRNAIPRFCRATIAVDQSDVAAIQASLAESGALITAQFAGRDGPVQFRAETQGNATRAFGEQDSMQLLDLVCALPDGVFAMTAEIPDLPETSNNVAVVATEGDVVRIACNSRSSFEPGMRDIASSLHAAARLVGAELVESAGYSGWKPNLASPVLDQTADLYRRLFQSEPKIHAIHAGLECGVLADKVPGLDCISFGPNIRGPHAPGEHVQISSVQKSFRLLVALLGGSRAPDKRRPARVRHAVFGASAGAMVWTVA